MQGFIVALLSIASFGFAQVAPSAPAAPSASSTPANTIVIINPMGVSGYAAGSTLQIVTAIGVTLGTALVQDLELSVQIPVTVAPGSAYCVRADLQGSAGFTYFFSPVFPITPAVATGGSNAPLAVTSGVDAPANPVASPAAKVPSVAFPSTDTITIISPIASQKFKSGQAIQIVWNNNGDTTDSAWLNTQVTFEIADASQGPNKVNPIGITLGSGMVKDLLLNANIPANAPTGGAFCIRAGIMGPSGFVYAFSPNFSMNGGTAVVVASGGGSGGAAVATTAAAAGAKPVVSQAATVSTTSGAKMNAAGILSAMAVIVLLF
ncbi:hypothetical protein HDU98_011179 [Podochytrium sp. JEL0797]|nr:hypothetical protein HDU98_011179 [Podochytrium sp. JEL0797]